MNEELDKYILAFPFPQKSDGADLVLQLKDLCAANGIHGEDPKMGTHATIRTPFLAPRDWVISLAMLLKEVFAIYGREVRVVAMRVGVFDPPHSSSDIGSIYVELDFPEPLRRLLEVHKSNWPLQYVYRPAQSTAVERVYIPHMSIIEAPDLHNAVQPILPKLNEYARGKVVTLHEPKFFIQKRDDQGKWWEQVMV